MAERTLSWIVAFVGAAVVESYITIESGLAHAHDYLYGAPLAIGQCHNDSLFALGNSCPFSWPLFIANIALTAAVFAGAAEAAGLVGPLAGILGALLSVRLFPRGADGAVELVPLWLTAMALGLLFALAIAGLTRLRRRGTPIRPRA
jgi:hypothetical protein